MRALGFRCLLPDELQSPVITSFLSPTDPAYQFPQFYAELKQRGFVIYPGKVSIADTFRIGTIGDARPHVIRAPSRPWASPCTGGSRQRHVAPARRAILTAS